MRDKIRKQISTPTCFLFLFWGTFLIYFIPLTNDWCWRFAIQVILFIAGWRIKTWRFTIIITALLTLLHIPAYLPELSSQSCTESVSAIEGTVKQSFKKSIRQLDFTQVKIFCGPLEFKRSTAHLSFSTEFKPYFFRSGDRLKIYKFSKYRLTPFSIEIDGHKRTKIFNESSKEKKLSKNFLYYYIQNKALYYLDDFPAAVYLGLTTADKNYISRTDKKIFQKLGISHLFAISGLHIGIIYLWLSLIFRKLISFSFPFIWKGKGLLLIDLFCLIAIFSYIQLIGSPVSARRAFYMLLWWIFIRHFIPWQSMWYILTAVGSIILIHQPQAIGQISYQLSFLSIAGILFIQPLFLFWRSNHSIWLKTGKAIILCFFISFYLFLLGFPIVNSFAAQFSVLSPLNNVFHIAFLSWVFLPICMIVFMVTILSYPFWGFSGEIYLYYIINLLGEFWKWSIDLSLSINSPTLLSLQVDWNFWKYLLYWGALGVGSYWIRERLLRKLRRS